MSIDLPGTDLALDDIRLGDIEQWMRPDREGIFAKLRAERPVSFHEEPVPPPDLGFDFPQGPGFWALTRYADVMQVSRDPDSFHSAPTSTVGDMPAEIAEWLGSMINMDAPKHTKLRLIVNRGFTPRQVARIDDSVREQATEIVERVAPMGECDFVREIAAALPLQIICDMMGIPREDTQQIFDLTNTILGVGDPEYVQTMEQLMAAGMGLFQYGIALAQDRLDNPRDDITTQLMQAEVEDENGKHRLTTAELGSFFLLLVAAGNETTRNAISHGMRALTDHPDQRKVWTSDFETVSPTAVEEIVRWATPVINFRRTATRDVVVGGQEVKTGQKVVMFYNSANRDERAFDDPYRFDVTRTPNEHLGFGAGGPHFCLGANLARREIKVMFEELFRRLPDIEVSGEPDYLQSAFIHGIKRMPCRFTKARA
ncbi:MAG: methyl-branched lipid omega-hydroxylase [Actinomycetota bacterium]|nr:methyl-branched lipid omega-hydroxylase [Actinomycetota bacterium]